MNSIDRIKEIAKNTILDEARTINQLVDYIDDDFAKVVELILNSKGRVVVTGIGKSANIATKIVATLNSTGTPSMFMHAADAIHGDLGMIMPDDIIICISKSGNTPEIKVLAPLIKNIGNTLVGMVAGLDSFLAKQSDYVLKAVSDKEADPNNLAPTNSTTAQLVIGDALAVSLLQMRQFSSQDFAKFHPGGALGKKLYLRVSDLLLSQIAPQVNPNDDIRTVILEISSKRMGAAAVISDDNVLLGIITDGDLRRMMQQYEDVKPLKAKDIMSVSPKIIGEDELAINAFHLMETNSITQLVVCEGDKYIGLVHLHDILKEGIV